MHTITKGLVTIAAGAAASVGLVLPAFASAPTTATVPASLSAGRAEVVGGGTGVLVAAGTGVAELSGNLDGSRIGGAGLLVITDHAGDAHIVISGRGGKTVVGDVTTYVGFNGRATISGSNVTVRLAGVRVTVAAKGDGTYYLKGHGRYDTRPNLPGGHGTWSADGTTGEL